MSARVRVAIVVLSAALVPAPAYAGTLTHTSPIARAAQDQSGELSPTPPVQLNGGKGESSSSNGSTSGSTSAALPDTGADLPTTALLALGLLVAGIGLRMRTVDERVF